jgi:hypothetical protein
MKAKKKPRYEPLPEAERKRVAESCLRGQNSSRASYAKEIEAGDLFVDSYEDEYSYPRSYWHCLATSPPPAPHGRRGQWKAEAERPSSWIWQDWGPAAE